ncbi:MAG TPA: COX15/CtaA family protein [Longimicrobiales bacterium]|nr:COX15/CtaA family protein [Longimicrobiales bacterium]
MLHPRAFRASVVWTLILLYLGSVVHATESSLACPDWPTCFGTMVPEMTGGVFWEHLHRLVAGGLLLLWGVATWLAHKEARERPWVFRASLAGVALLLVQSIFGGLTVIYRLPDLVSTTHLALALSFLVLATVLYSATQGSVHRGAPFHDELDGTAGLRGRAATMAGIVFVQSVLGGLVRHTDAGMACPDAPLCLGQLVPPLVNTPITLHFAHRLLALVATIAVCGFAVRVYRRTTSRRLRRWALASAGLVLAQVALGFASVLTVLAVVPVSLHTLVAASLLAVLAHIATIAEPARRGAEAPQAVTTV